MVILTAYREPNGKQFFLRLSFFCPSEATVLIFRNFTRVGRAYLIFKNYGIWKFHVLDLWNLEFHGIGGIPIPRYNSMEFHVIIHGTANGIDGILIPWSSIKLFHGTKELSLVGYFLSSTGTCTIACDPRTNTSRKNPIESYPRC